MQQIVNRLIFGVLSGIAYALYSIFGSMALKKYHPYTVTFYSFFFAGLASVVLSFVTNIGKAAPHIFSVLQSCIPRQKTVICDYENAAA